MSENEQFYAKFCPHCAKTGEDFPPMNDSVEEQKRYNYYSGFITWLGEDENKCPFCSTKLKNTSMLVDDLETIKTASDYNRELLEEMIELKKENPEEYEIRITQTRFVAEKNKQADQERKKYEITCPRCGSTNTSTDVRRVGVFEILFGASGYYRVCNTCGYRWKPGTLLESIDRIHYGHK